jgi:Leucine-rich repeat (LRR) protein
MRKIQTTPTDPNQGLPGACFETSLDVLVLIRRQEERSAEWQELGQGPGPFVIPEGFEAKVQVRGIDDKQLQELLRDLAECRAVVFLDLAENRKITDRGISRLAALPWLTGLNLSSCALSNTGLQHLAAFKKLEYLNLCYCNRLNNSGIRILKSLPRLVYLNLQGCLGITHAGARLIEKKGLTIYRG